jgi:hypothetical protein
MAIFPGGKRGRIKRRGKRGFLRTVLLLFKKMCTYLIISFFYALELPQ